MEKIIFISMACLIIGMSIVLWKSIVQYKKINKQYKQAKKEAAIQQLEWLLLKKQLKIICDFLPDPDKKNYEFNNES